MRAIYSCKLLLFIIACKSDKNCGLVLIEAYYYKISALLLNKLSFGVFSKTLAFGGRKE